jgi:hypothetical protein
VAPYLAINNQLQIPLNTSLFWLNPHFPMVSTCSVEHLRVSALRLAGVHRFQLRELLGVQALLLDDYSVKSGFKHYLWEFYGIIYGFVMILFVFYKGVLFGFTMIQEIEI